MPRKTKEEALVTRCRILDAAERVFQRKGVSGTSLQDIAQAAGVTRGAVYWHFKDKADVFNAMMSRVCLPIEESAQLVADDGGADPLATVRTEFRGIFERLVSDVQVRRVFEVATHKVEYVDELTAVRERHLQMRSGYLRDLERRLRRAQRSGHVTSRPSARQLAIGLHALLDGLIQNWMLEPGAFDLRQVGSRAVDVHLAGMAPGPAAGSA
jgi:TetR/AcrR family acrAB operon transcriptional repressor